MTLTLLSLGVGIACALASIRRLIWVIAPTALDPWLLAEALDKGAAGTWSGLRDAVSARQDTTWERDLLAALAEPDHAVRAALVSEQVTELDWRAQRWERVPRVCASIATSSGFLFGCIALLHTLSVASAESRFDGSAGTALGSAVNALAVGLAGTSFCLAVHVRARHALQEQRLANDRLAKRLDILVRCPPTAPR